MTAADRAAVIDHGQMLREIARVRGLLDGHARGGGARTSAPDAPAERTALAGVCSRFSLSPFERDLLVLCAGAEVDASFAAACALAHGDATRRHATFGLALAALPDAHWSAITPDGNLRRYRLLEPALAPGVALTEAPLRIDERVLHHLVGVDELDPRLACLVERCAVEELTGMQRALADRLVRAWRERTGSRTAVWLRTDDAARGRGIATAACEEMGLALWSLPVALLPDAPAELERLVRLWERDATLSGLALWLDAGDRLSAEDAERGHAATWRRLVERIDAPVLFAAPSGAQLVQRPLLTLDVAGPTPDEARAVWRAALRGVELNGALDRVVDEFTLPACSVHAAARETLGSHAPDAPADAIGRTLWTACRRHVRPGLDTLAQQVVPAAGWDDLVLPAGHLDLLRQIADQVRHRHVVHERWGFSTRGQRGLGIGALFAGASGTGKTMAAEVLATELSLDLYRIDLSQVVDKYIGETEKRLRRVFDAAERGGAILLFDEADALFGKRSEVKDSHDRYANIEVGYLLQRMESFRGLAILTTNMRGALDDAFRRRLRFVIEFPFPDAPLRAAIWQRAFPTAAPTEGLDWDRLARLTVTGGHIRNIAVNAAFAAAAGREPVRMRHVLSAARAEYAKLERPLSESEIGGWA